jgi:hypothetical protein
MRPSIWCFSLCHLGRRMKKRAVRFCSDFTDHDLQFASVKASVVMRTRDPRHYRRYRRRSTLVTRKEHISTVEHTVLQVDRLKEGFLCRDICDMQIIWQRLTPLV